MLLRCCCCQPSCRCLDRWFWFISWLWPLMAKTWWESSLCALNVSLLSLIVITNFSKLFWVELNFFNILLSGSFWRKKMDPPWDFIFSSWLRNNSWQTWILTLLFLGFKHVLAPLSKKSSNSFMSPEMLLLGKGVSISKKAYPGVSSFSWDTTLFLFSLYNFL